MPVLGGPHLDAGPFMKAAVISVATNVPHPGETDTQTIVQIPVATVTEPTITYNNGLYTPSPTPQITLDSTSQLLESFPTLSSLETAPTSALETTQTSLPTLVVTTSSILETRTASFVSSSSAAASSSASTAAHKSWPLAYNLVIAGACISLVAAVGFFYARTRNRKRRRQEMAEDFLQRRMPHGWTDDDDFDEKQPSMKEAGLPGFATEQDYYYDDTSKHGQYATSVSNRDFQQTGDRGWAWGREQNARVRRNVTPPNRHQQSTSEDLDAYLAESRTGYTPAEAEIHFTRQPSFADRLYDTMLGHADTRENQASQRNVNEPYGFSRGEENDCSPKEDALNTKPVNPLHVANPDLPSKPQSIQSNDAQISRSVKRWQLADRPMNQAAEPARPSTPTNNRFSNQIDRDSPYKTPERKAAPSDAHKRMPSSLQPARYRPTAADTPLTPPTQPLLFFSTSKQRSPGCAMPPADSEQPLSQTFSLDGLAAMVFPGREESNSRDQDVFTALPSRQRRDTITSPGGRSEASDYSADHSSFSSPQAMLSPRHQSIRRAIAERRKGAYERMEHREV